MIANKLLLSDRPKITYSNSLFIGLVTPKLWKIVCPNDRKNCVLQLPTSDAGLSDVPGESMVKLYCPKCQDVYTPKSSRHHHTDGAYFGTGFPHMLFMVHAEYRPKRPPNQFIPRYCSYYVS